MLKCEICLVIVYQLKIIRINKKKQWQNGSTDRWMDRQTDREMETETESRIDLYTLLYLLKQYPYN